MATQNIGGPQLQGMRLDTDFGHSPLGRLGGRSVQQVQAQGPRAQGAGEGFLAGVKRLASRLLDAVTPHGVRAESKFRAGLEATSARVGDLLGALTHGDAQGVRNAVNALPRDAQPVTSRGVAFDRLLDQRIAVNLKNMSTEQLVQLKAGTANAGADPVTATTVALVASKVQQELMERLIAKATQDLKPVLERSFSELPRGRDAVDYQYRSCYGLADALLKEHGQQETSAMQRAVIKQVIERLLDNDELDLQQTGELFNALPTRELHDLLHSSATLGNEVPFTTERMLTGAIGVRAQKLEADFQLAANRLLAHGQPAVDDPGGPLHAPQAFAREVVQAAQLLAELRQHADVHGLHVPEAVDNRYAHLLAHLEDLLQPDNLMLGELNHSQLSAFKKAMDTLGVEASATEINTEIQQRKTAVLDAYSQAIAQVATAAGQGDLGAMLIALDSAQKRADEALQTHQRLGEKIDDTDKIMQFRETILARAVSGMSVEQLGGLFHALNTPEGKALGAAAAEAGMSLLPGMESSRGRDPELGKRMFNAYTDLQLLDMVVRDQLQQQGVNLPPQPDEHDYGMEDLGPRGRQALLDAFGVEVSESGKINVKAGVAGPTVQSIFERNLQGMEQTAAVPYQYEGTDTGVFDACWRDLPRAHYSLGQTGGGSTTVTQKGTMAPHQSQDWTGQMFAAVDTLRQAFGNDEGALLRVSKFAHQGVLAGLQEALMTKDSPIRLPDGTAGRPMGTENNHFKITPDGEGGALLRVDYSLTNVTMLHDPVSDRIHHLDPQTSRAHFSFELAIAPDGSVRVSDPLQFAYEMTPLPEDPQ